MNLERAPMSTSHIVDELEAYTKLLIITVWRGGYPHEVITFMYNKLFESHPPAATAKGMQTTGTRKIWPPRRIVKEHAHRELIYLARTLSAEYQLISTLPGTLVEACFNALYRKMLYPLQSIIKTNDQGARKRWASILDRFVGETPLGAYFGKNPEADIANWSHKVTQNVRKVVVAENWMARPLEELLAEIQQTFQD